MKFEYNGQKYEVKESADEIYNNDYLIELPDKEIVIVLDWLEIYPPIPLNIDKSFKRQSKNKVIQARLEW